MVMCTDCAGGDEHWAFLTVCVKAGMILAGWEGYLIISKRGCVQLGRISDFI